MAYDFDGADQLVTGSTDILKGAAAASMSAWIRRDASQNDFAGIINYRIATASSFECVLEVRSSNIIRSDIWTATDGFNAVEGSTTITLNGWDHAAMTYDGSDHKVFLNGVEEATDPHTGNLRSNNREVWIGRNPDDEATFLGRIDEPVIWNAALTLNEIIALYRGVRPRRIRPTSIVGGWPLWGAHSPEIDLSGNGNSLAITGAVVANGAPVTLWTPK